MPWIVVRPDFFRLSAISFTTVAPLATVVQRNAASPLTPDMRQASHRPRSQYPTMNVTALCAHFCASADRRMEHDVQGDGCHCEGQDGLHGWADVAHRASIAPDPSYVRGRRPGEADGVRTQSECAPVAANGSYPGGRHRRIRDRITPPITMTTIAVSWSIDMRSASAEMNIGAGLLKKDLPLSGVTRGGPRGRVNRFLVSRQTDLRDVKLSDSHAPSTGLRQRPFHTVGKTMVQNL